MYGMKRFSQTLFFVLFMLVIPAILSASEVLLLHSYHKGFKWSDDISFAIEKAFRNRPDIEITTEYMDTKRVYNETYLNRFYKLFKSRYEKRQFDIVIVSDNNAYEFVKKHYDELFQNLPVLFCGLNDVSLDEISLHPAGKRLTGVVEEVDVLHNIQLIQTLQPNLKKLLILNDTTPTAKAIKAKMDEVLREFPDLEFEYVDSLPVSEIKERINDLDSDSAVLFLMVYRDKQGQILHYEDLLTELSGNSPVPIYGLWDFYLNFGITGGLLTHANAQGSVVASMALKVLDGTKPSDLPIVINSPNQYMFDYPLLNKYGLDLSRLPKESQLINRPKSFYEKHKNAIWAVVIVTSIALLVIFLQAFSMFRQKQLQIELNNKLKFIEVLLDTIQQPMVYKDLNNRYAGVNQAFAEMAEIPKEELIGKDVYAVFNKEFADESIQVEEKLYKTGGFVEYESRYQRNDGEWRNVLMTKGVYYGINGEIGGIVSVINDITEIKKSENDRKQNEQFMIQQSKLAEIGDMLSAIAHQWNEPLVEISAIVQDLEHMYKTGRLEQESVNQFVQECMIQIQYMSKTLKDFRNFIKPSKEKETFLIQDSFESILEIVGRQLKYSYVRVNIGYQKEEMTAYGYPNEFKQVLIAIIRNSRDAIYKERTLKQEDFEGVITIDVVDEGHMAIIRICDNGCGIPSEELDKIFESNYSTKLKGHGVGLYMSRMLIQDKMKGRIRAFMVNGRTCIEVQVPRSKKIEKKTA